MYLLPLVGLLPLNSVSMLAVVAATDLVACCVAAWHQVVKDHLAARRLQRPRSSILAPTIIALDEYNWPHLPN
jgi:hypothetical protein